MATKKKLLVLLGAGSSVEQGFPSTEKLDGEMRGWAREYAKNKGTTDFFGRLWKNRADYSKGYSQEQRAIFAHHTDPNFERVLGDLHALLNGVLPKPHGDPILRHVARAEVFLRLKIAPERRGRGQHGSNKAFYEVEGQLGYLHRKLADKMRRLSNVFEIELAHGMREEKFRPYYELFAGLGDAFRLGVYNLNYDPVALHARPKAFVGFDRKTGRFLPADVLGREKWEFIYHLHGSIHHRVRYGSRVMEHHSHSAKLLWHEDLSQTGDMEDWEDTGFVETRSDEKRMLLTSLVAGGWKLDQLQTDPYLTFYSTLIRHAHAADAIVIGGYGFGDSHINAVLKTVMQAKSSAHERPPVLVIDQETNARAIAKRNDRWSSGLSRALHISAQSFRCRSERTRQSCRDLPDQVPAGEFEQSSQAPVAIWNQGFTSASVHLPEMVRWLEGDQSAL